MYDRSGTQRIEIYDENLDYRKMKLIQYRFDAEAFANAFLVGEAVQAFF